MKEKVIEMPSEEDFCSKILNTMEELGEKLDSDVQKVPEDTQLTIS